MSASELLADLLGPMEEKLGTAKDELATKAAAAEQAKEAERQAKEDVRTLEGMIARIKGEKLGSGGRPKAKSKSNGSVSDERREEVLAVIKKLGEATVAEIRKDMDLKEGSESSIRAAVNKLREDEKVRKAGFRPRPDGVGRGSDIFKVM